MLSLLIPPSLLDTENKFGTRINKYDDRSKIDARINVSERKKEALLLLRAGPTSFIIHVSKTHAFITVSLLNMRDSPVRSTTEPKLEVYT